MENKELKYIEVKKIHPNPNNPRKDLGDIEELSESIKVKGVMQNLTVVESKEHPGEYMAVIGHRRRAAAEKAGVEKVPCIITEMSEEEQFEVMMLENMQRNNLTIYEQAQGFQMMLDFGKSVDEIAEKTGFSKTTVYHRLNIAKLNQKELQKKENDSDFQLSFKDLIELEKIESVRTRNKVLKEARDSKNLAFRAREAVTEEKREKNKKTILKKLKDRNLKPCPEGVSPWTNGWEQIKSFNLDDNVNEKVTLKKSKEQLYFVSYYSRLYIMRKLEKSEEISKGVSEEEKQLRRDRKKIKLIQENLADKIQKFINDILKQKPENNNICSLAWKYLIADCRRLDNSEIYILMSDTDKSWYSMTEEAKKELKEKFEKYSLEYQMLAVINIERIPDMYSYHLSYQESAAQRVKILVDILIRFGFSVTNEEQQLINGTHELLRK